MNFSFPSLSSDVLEQLQSLQSQIRALTTLVHEVQQKQELTQKRVKIIHSLFNEYKSEKDTVYDFLNKQLSKINIEILNEQKIAALEAKLHYLESRLGQSSSRTKN